MTTTNLIAPARQCHPGSRASSLAPSDSASHITKLNASRMIEDLLERADPPPIRPDLEALPFEVLWDFRDCKVDTMHGLIVTTKNLY